MKGLMPSTSASVCGSDGVGRLSDSNSARNDLSLITYRAKPVVVMALVMVSISDLTFIFAAYYVR